jgi:carboxymethylenebutenolidase
MGQMVEFPSNGSTGSGYLATPEQGAGPGVVVIQEWWGLVDHIKEVCDRLATEGFTALAPDLYRGEKATEPDEAGKLMMALNLDQAAKDMGGAVDFLKAHDAVRGEGVGVIGFCMGGGLALVLSVQKADEVRACVPFYGVIPWPSAQPDWSKLQAAVQGHYAEKDAFFTPEAAHELEAKLHELGKEAQIFVYQGADHAFFNDARPDAYDEHAARQAWTRALEFLRAKLG